MVCIYTGPFQSFIYVIYLFSVYNEQLEHLPMTIVATFFCHTMFSYVHYCRSVVIFIYSISLFSVNNERLQCPQNHRAGRVWRGIWVPKSRHRKNVSRQHGLISKNLFWKSNYFNFDRMKSLCEIRVLGSVSQKKILAPDPDLWKIGVALTQTRVIRSGHNFAYAMCKFVSWSDYQTQKCCFTRFWLWANVISSN